jgi:hypothetical protein
VFLIIFAFVTAVTLFLWFLRAYSNAVLSYMKYQKEGNSNPQYPYAYSQANAPTHG